MIQPIFHHSGNTTELFLDDTLELDVSIAEGSIFGILGSEKRSAQPMPEARVCGKLNTIKEVEWISLRVKYDLRYNDICEERKQVSLI